MRDFILNAKQNYDIIIFDSPPAIAVTDPTIISTYVDASIVVAYAGKTPIKALQHCAEQIASVGSKVNGVVLNNFDIKKNYLNYYSYYRMGYYEYSSNGSSNGKSAVSQNGNNGNGKPGKSRKIKLG